MKLRSGGVRKNVKNFGVILFDATVYIFDIWLIVDVVT